MTRASLAITAAALLLSACAKDNGRASAVATDSAANAATAPTPGSTDAPRPGLTGAPAFARQGVDSSNAAQQHRLDEVNQLSDQASGTAKP